MSDPFEHIFTKYFPVKSTHRNACKEIWYTAQREAVLISKPDFHDDAIEQLAFELAAELEDAELNAGDLVTINRAKLRAIAGRVYDRLKYDKVDGVVTPAQLGAAVDDVTRIVKSAARESNFVDGKPCTLADCPPGLFRKEGSFGLKTEYQTSITEGLYTYYYPEAFVVASGEYWWGGEKTHKTRAEQIVIPVTFIGDSDG